MENTNKEKFEKIKEEFFSKPNDSESFRLYASMIALIDKIQDEKLLCESLKTLERTLKVREIENTKRYQMDKEKYIRQTMAFTHFVDTAGGFFIHAKGLSSGKSQEEINKDLDKWESTCDQVNCSNW